MSSAFRAHFDGRAIVPDEPIDLAPGQVLNVVAVIPGQPVPRFAELTLFAVDLPDAPPDLSSRHDDYLAGRLP